MAYASHSTGSSAPLNPSQRQAICAACTAIAAGCGTSGPARWGIDTDALRGRKFLVMPSDASVFAMERWPSGSMPVRARIASIVSGMTIVLQGHGVSDAFANHPVTVDTDSDLVCHRICS